MSEAHCAARAAGTTGADGPIGFRIDGPGATNPLVTGRSSSRECAPATTSRGKVVRPSDSGLGSTLALAGGDPAPGV